MLAVSIRNGMTKRGTSFARWMHEMGWTVRRTAEEIGLSPARVQHLSVGRDYGDGRGDARPDLLTRMAMSALKAGVRPSKRLSKHRDEKDRDATRVLLALAAAEAKLEPYPAD